MQDGRHRRRRRRSRRCPRSTRSVGVPDRRAADRSPEGRRGPLERGDVRLTRQPRTATRGRAGPSQEGPARPRARRYLGALPFFLYVAVFLLLPVGVLAVEAFRATDPVTFEETWSTDSIVAVTEGPYRRAYGRPPLVTSRGHPHSDRIPGTA